MPLSSRCAITTISFSESPAFRATRLASSVFRPLIVAVNVSRFTSNPYGASCSVNQRCAPSAPAVPGTRFGYRSVRSWAMTAAALPLNAVSRPGAVSAGGRETVNARRRMGSTTSSQAPR